MQDNFYYQINSNSNSNNSNVISLGLEKVMIQCVVAVLWTRLFSINDVTQKLVFT